MLPVLALGTQGWSYADWVGTMYDAGTRPDGYLRAYAREFNSVEIDSTFYGTPPQERVRAWVGAVPPAFTFALKLPREITHDLRLIGCGRALEEFVASARLFGSQLEGVLIQLPPDFAPAEFAPLAAFLNLLPDDVRWSLELRAADWFEAGVLSRLREELRAHGIALALTDGTFVPRETMLEQLTEPTARHAYVRWLGVREAVTRFDRELFDRRAELRLWANALRRAPRLERVSGYANNHYAGHSPAVIRAFYAELGVVHHEPRRIEQTSLF